MSGARRTQEEFPQSTPGGIWSLLDVLRFYASVFGVSVAHFMHNSHEIGYHPSDASKRPALKEAAKGLLVDLRETQASALIIQSLERLIEHFDEMDSRVLCGQCQSVFNMVMFDCQEKIYFQVQPLYKPYFVESSQPFGEKVASVFAEAVDDIGAAARCLAFDENNACVFHLMRVLEHGLRTLAAEIGLTDFGLENWKNIIDQIESNIRGMEKLPKSQEKNDRVRRLSAAAVQFRYFKDAWRNHSTHSRAWYDEHSARSIFEHVRQFMRELADDVAAPT